MIKKIAIITLFSLLIGIIYLFQNKIFVLEEPGSKRPPRIMLFTCQYGSGHKMATQSIVESLPDCEIQVVDIYNEPLASLDPMRSWAPAFSNEQIYNKLIKNEQNHLLNLSGKIAPKILLLQKGKIQKLLTQYISQDKPDLLISCIPLLNASLLSVADELNIPFLVVTTDIDVSAFCYDLPKDLEPNKSHFRITIPYQKTQWDKLFGDYFSKTLRNSFQYGFGYPTRKIFSEKPGHAVLNRLRVEYEIKKDENIILVMMGGNAGQASMRYAMLLKQLSNSDLDRVIGKENPRDKIHLICLCGDTSIAENHAFMESLNALNDSEQASRIRIHGCPATSKIGELASLSELRLVISKPGGSTVNEMIKKKVPMIYHNTPPLLDWEKGNVEYGESRGFGKRFFPSKNPNSNDVAVFADLLTEAFALSKEMRSAKIPVPEAEIDFTSNLRQTIQEMLSIYTEPGQKSKT